VEIPIDEKDLLEEQQMKRQEANAHWDALEEKMKTTSPEGPASSRGLGWISGVPAYIWRCGCTPTAAGMVLGYWDSHGYPNFPSETTLIDELGVAMHTGVPPRPDGWTYNSDVAPGIEEVCDNHNYLGFVAQLEAIEWNRVKEEVDASRPFVLILQQGVGYGDHSVTGLGYSDYDEDYVFIHDTYDESTHTILYGSWDQGTKMVWVMP
jgi:hypothetical protein